jgi:hypothetical protein
LIAATSPAAFNMSRRRILSGFSGIDQFSIDFDCAVEP